MMRVPSILHNRGRANEIAQTVDRNCVPAMDRTLRGLSRWALRRYPPGGAETVSRSSWHLKHTNSLLLAGSVLLSALRFRLQTEQVTDSITTGAGLAGAVFAPLNPT